MPESKVKRCPALSLHRPWTTLVLRHGKNIENRGWWTAYRGPLLIHGAKPWDGSALDLAAQIVGPGETSPFDADHPTGIVGVVDLVGVCELSRDTSTGACECGPWAMPGQYHWRLANPRSFAEPIPCGGKQRLWTPPAEIWLAVLRELTRRNDSAVAHADV